MRLNHKILEPYIYEMEIKIPHRGNNSKIK